MNNNYRPNQTSSLADKRIGTVVTRNDSTSAWLEYGDKSIEFEGGIGDLLAYACAKGVNIKHHINNQPAAL